MNEGIPGLPGPGGEPVAQLLALAAGRAGAGAEGPAPGPEAALEAVERLYRIAAQSAAGGEEPQRAAAVAALEQIASGEALDKAVGKAAGRALYRLRSAGKLPAAGEAVGKARAHAAAAAAAGTTATAPGTSTAPGTATAPAPRTVQVRVVGAATRLRGLSTRVDGLGYWHVLYAVRKASGGLRAFAGRLHEVEGLVDLVGMAASRRELEETQEAFAEDAHPDWVVDVDPAWAQAVLLDGARRRQEAGKGLPKAFLLWKSELRDPDPGPVRLLVEQGRAPVSPELVAEVRERQGLLLQASDRLLDQKELGGWPLPAEQLSPFAQRLIELLRSPIELSPHAHREQQERVESAAIAAVFDEGGRARYARRLWITAYLLERLGKPEAARWALAVAMALEEGRPGWDRIPFVRDWIGLNLELAVDDLAPDLASGGEEEDEAGDIDGDADQDAELGGSLTVRGRPSLMRTPGGLLVPTNPAGRGPRPKAGS